MGHAARRARDLDPLGPALRCRARARRAAARRAATRRHARVRLGGVAVLAVRLELEHERHDPAGAARLGLLLRRLAQVARRVRGPVGVDEVRAADRRCRSGRAIRMRGGLRSRVSFLAGFAIATALAFFVLLLEPSPWHAAGRLLPPHVRLPARARLAVLALGLGQYHAKGLPDLHWVQNASSRGCCSPARSRSAGGRAAARRSAWPRSRARCSSASSSC